MVGIYSKGTIIVEELGKFKGHKVMIYEMNDFIGGLKRIPRSSNGQFEMQDGKVVGGTKHFNICRMLGRKGTGYVIMKVLGESGTTEKICGWTIRNENVRPVLLAGGKVKLLGQMKVMEENKLKEIMSEIDKKNNVEQSSEQQPSPEEKEDPMDES
jgi:hypothetical protein